MSFFSRVFKNSKKSKRKDDEERRIQQIRDQDFEQRMQPKMQTRKNISSSYNINPALPYTTKQIPEMPTPTKIMSTQERIDSLNNQILHYRNQLNNRYLTTKQQQDILREITRIDQLIDQLRRKGGRKQSKKGGNNQTKKGGKRKQTKKGGNKQTKKGKSKTRKSIFW